MDFRNIWADNASDTLSITSELTTSSLSLFSSNYHHYQYNNDDFNNFEINSFGRTTTPTTTESALSSSPPLTELNSDTQSLCSNSNRYDGHGQHPSTSTSTSTAITSDRRQKIYCETVSVANSGHVAQIVGKNGCKIKHLRAKYGTYIHTPAANEEPVFIIRGPKDKVMAVKQEIIRADNHFAEIKQARNVKIMQKIDSNGKCLFRKKFQKIFQSMFQFSKMQHLFACLYRINILALLLVVMVGL